MVEMAVGLGAVSRPLKGAVINIFTMPYVARCPSVLTPPTHTKLDGKSHPPSRSHAITGMKLVQESAKGSLIFNRKAGLCEQQQLRPASERVTCTLLTAWFVISCVDRLNLWGGRCTINSPGELATAKSVVWLLHCRVNVA